jgi:hypothetical protein
MEFKSNIGFKIIMGFAALFFVILPFYVIFTENILERTIWFIILFIFFSPLLIIMGLDVLYQILRIIIIDEKNIKVKLFGKTIKESKIETIEFNNKHYGIRKITYGFGVKSIIVNKKYFSCVTKMDFNYDNIIINNSIT